MKSHDIVLIKQNKNFNDFCNFGYTNGSGVNVDYGKYYYIY